MQSKIVTFLLLLWSIACFGHPTFEGTYKCKGFDPYLNKIYSGTVKIVQYNTVYNLLMEYDTGDTAIGTAGLWDRETIAVVFQDIKDPKIVGLERYSFTTNHKKIQGYWVYLGKDKLGKEVCERE